MNKSLCCFLLLAFLAGCATDPQQLDAAARMRRAQTLRGTFGTYDNEPRLPD